MPNQGRGASASAERDVLGSPPLPDLSGVDLQGLRLVDDPAVSAAVDDVLRHPGRYADLWWGPTDGGNGGNGNGGKNSFDTGQHLSCLPKTRRRAI